MYPAVVERPRCASREIALVALGGLDAGDRRRRRAARSGRPAPTLAEVAVVREPPDLEALARRVGERRARASVERGEPEELDARRRARRPRAGRGGAALRRAARRRCSAATAAAGRDRRRGRRPPAARATSSPTRRRRPTRSRTGLIAGLARRRRRTVGRRDHRRRPVLDRVLRRPRARRRVDNVDLISGRVALVFALGGAASGNFGVKETRRQPAARPARRPTSRSLRAPAARRG